MKDASEITTLRPPSAIHIGKLIPPISPGIRIDRPLWAEAVDQAAEARAPTGPR